MPNKKTAYRSLREWREARKLNQAEASALLALNQPYYSKVERLLLVPRPERAKAISVKTGVSVESILGIA